MVVGLYIGRMPATIISDFDILKSLLKTAECSARPCIYPFNHAKAGHDAKHLENCAPGLLLTKGRSWQEQRRTVMRHLRDLGFAKADAMEGLFHDELEKLFALMDADRERSGPVDLTRGLGISIVNALWKIMVGEQFSLDDPKLMELLILMNTAMRETSPQSLLALMLPFKIMVKLPILRDISGFSRAKAFFEKIEAFLR